MYFSVSQGLQSRDRHLFLFNDLLLIAKARSGGHFKLKDKVRISELWLSTGIEEVAEGSAGKSRDTSFVIGWPPSVNLVATFRYDDTRIFFTNFHTQKAILVCPVVMLRRLCPCRKNVIAWGFFFLVLRRGCKNKTKKKYIYIDRKESSKGVIISGEMGGCRNVSNSPGG